MFPTVVGCSRSSDGQTQVAGTDRSGLDASVAAVIDGDTVELSFAGRPPEMARLLGVDTPETVKPDSPVECFGPEASARLGELLPPQTPVVVQRDVEARDRYGRLLVYLWRRSDGLFINRELVTGGFARTLSIAPNDAFRIDLARSQVQAREARAGLWEACPAAS